MPFNPTSGKHYRGGNAVHLMVMGMSKGYEDPRWLTYRQANENGWQVRRAEKGTQIEFWQFHENGSISNESAREGKQHLEDSRFIYRVYTVFNASQVDGIPEHAAAACQEWEVEKAGEAILAQSGARIFHDQADRAFYNLISDSIHLPPRSAFKTTGDYYGTALHELGHWTGARTRLNRETLTQISCFGDPTYAKKELRAELASVFLMAERGIPNDASRNASYVGHWVGVLKGDKHEIFRAARDAHRAADLLLALELHKSLDQALAHINRPDSTQHQPQGEVTIDTEKCNVAENQPTFEMEF